MTKGYAATFLDCEDTPSSTGPAIKIPLVKLCLPSQNTVISLFSLL